MVELLFENWIEKSKREEIHEYRKRWAFERMQIRFFQKERAMHEDASRVTGNNYSLKVLTDLLTWLNRWGERDDRSIARLLGYMRMYLKRSSEQEHMENALASGAEEGRDKLR